MILQNYECHKKATNQQPLLRYLGQKQSTMHDPCTQQHHGVGRPAGPSLLSNHKPPLPSLHVRNQPALLREQARVPCFLRSLPCAAAQVPGKPCLNFFFFKDAYKNHAYILEKVAQQYALKIKSENIFLQDDKYRLLIQDGDIGRSWIHLLPQKLNRQLYMEQFPPKKKPSKVSEQIRQRRK